MEYFDEREEASLNLCNNGITTVDSSGEMEDLTDLKKFHGERVLRRRKSLPVVREIGDSDVDFNKNVKSENIEKRETINNSILQERRLVQRAMSNSQVQYVMIRAAISEDSLLELQALLRRRNVNINHIEADGLSAIHYAAMYGSRETVEILVNEGAKFNLVSKQGQYPLDIAVRTGNYEIAQYLIGKGARLDHVINGTPLEQEERLKTRRRNRAHTIDIPAQEVPYYDA